GLPVCVLSLEVQSHRVALHDASAFNWLGPSCTFAQPLQSLFGCAIIHRGRRSPQCERGIVAGLEWRQGVEGSREGQRLTFLHGDVANIWSVDRLNAPFAQCFVDCLRNQVLDNLMEDLFLETLFDDASRRLAWPKPRYSRFARVVTGMALDLRVHHV